jgi:peptidoglycan/LPS O-acetylase OafA/YrhL
MVAGPASFKTTATKSRPYRPDIDGLRALAVLAVVVYHAFPEQLQGGFVGVDIFFVISGYLISSIIHSGLQEGTFRFGNFYASRIRRIFPALFIVLAFCLMAGWLLLLSDELSSLLKHTAAGALFVQNFLLFDEVGYFDTRAELKPLLHLWSLSVEEQFYIAYPLLLWLLLRTRRTLLALIIICLISFSLHVTWHNFEPERAFYFPHSRFWELLAGGILAYFDTIYRGRSVEWLSERMAIVPPPLLKPRTTQELERSVCNVLSGAGILLILAALLFTRREISSSAYWAAFPVVGAVLVILAGSGSWLNQNLLANRPMVLVGLVSYPLYLWHWPMMSFSRIIQRDSHQVMLGCVVISFILALLTYRFVERPVRSGKPSNAKVFGPVLLLAAIASASLYAKNHTFSWRTVLIDRGDLGSSERWLRGSDDWLFLGNAYDETLRKLESSIEPSAQQTRETREQFDHLARTGGRHGIPIALLIAPDKSRVYPEHLPKTLNPAQRRYVDHFLDELRTVPNLVVHDPLDEFLANKTTGPLYWKTDTHWNQKGALLAWNGLGKKIYLPAAPVTLRTSDTPHSGDLIIVSGLTDLPLQQGDNYDVVWEVHQDLITHKLSTANPRMPFSAEVVRNDHALTNRSAWIIGDSFTDGLRPYINATFRETHYIGHWNRFLSGHALSNLLDQAGNRPDVIIVVRVERSF